jgi:tetratricopeptide (TPR) repeat protein
MKNPFKNSLLNIFSGFDTSRHFLVKRSKNKAPAAHEPADEGMQAMPQGDEGELFIHQAMARLEASAAFGAMVIRPDTADPDDSGGKADDLPERVRETARVVDGVCSENQGVWGLVDSATIGCYFNEINDADCLALSRRIQEKILQRKHSSVSIGMAVFPMSDFNRRDIMENARKALDHAAFLGPNSAVLFDAVSLNISGDRAYQKGDVAGAVKEFQSALKLDAENINVLNSLGVCYGAQGALAEALQSFESVMALDADHVMAHYNAGYVCTLLGRNDQAMQYFLKADGIGEAVYEVAFQIGKLYLEMANPASAKTFLQKALLINPDAAVTHFHLGECFKALGETDQAVSHYETAVKKNPNDAAALSALGALYDAKGENPEISTLFCEKSVEISPDNGMFRYRLGTVYANNDMPEKALDAFESAVRLGHDAALEMEQTRELLAYGQRKRVSN